MQVILQQQLTIAERQGVVAEVTRSLEQVSADSEARLQVILQQQATIAEQQATIAEQQALLAKQRATIAEQEATLAEQQAALAERQAALAEQQTKLNALERNAFVRLLRFSKLLRNPR